MELCQARLIVSIPSNMAPSRDPVATEYHPATKKNASYLPLPLHIQTQGPLQSSSFIYFFPPLWKLELFRVGASTASYSLNLNPSEPGFQYLTSKDAEDIGETQSSGWRTLPGSAEGFANSFEAPSYTKKHWKFLMLSGITESQDLKRQSYN